MVSIIGALPSAQDLYQPICQAICRAIFHHYQLMTSQKTATGFINQFNQMHLLTDRQVEIFTKMMIRAIVYQESALVLMNEGRYWSKMSKAYKQSLLVQLR